MTITLETLFNKMEEMGIKSKYINQKKEKEKDKKTDIKKDKEKNG